MLCAAGTTSSVGRRPKMERSPTERSNPAPAFVPDATAAMPNTPAATNGEVPGEVEVGERGAGGDEPAAAGIANQQIHRRTRQHVAGERGEVEGCDRSHEL